MVAVTKLQHPLITQNLSKLLKNFFTIYITPLNNLGEIQMFSLLTQNFIV